MLSKRFSRSVRRRGEAAADEVECVSFAAMRGYFVGTHLPLGRSVLGQSLTAGCSWLHRSRCLTLSVAVAASQMRGANVMKWPTAALTGIDNFT